MLKYSVSRRRRARSHRRQRCGGRPDDAELGLGLASHLLIRQRHAESEEAYRRVLTIDPRNQLAWLGIATVFDQTNRTDELAALVGEAERAGVGPEGAELHPRLRPPARQEICRGP